MGRELKDANGNALCRRCRIPKNESGHERGCTWYGRPADKHAHLHKAPCPVPMWDMVGRHFGRERPGCTCGADAWAQS